MTCTNCNKELTLVQVTCNYCGYTLSDEEVDRRSKIHSFFDNKLRNLLMATIITSASMMGCVAPSSSTQYGDDSYEEVETTSNTFGLLAVFRPHHYHHHRIIIARRRHY